jgi:hypothetical protein
MRNSKTASLTCNDLEVTVLAQPELPVVNEEFIFNEKIIFQTTKDNKKKWSTPHPSSNNLSTDTFYLNSFVSVIPFITHDTPKLLIHTRSTAICPYIYLSFIWDIATTESTPFPLVESLSVVLNDKYITNTSSRIVINNKTNFHVFQLFPDSSDDCIKQNFITGVNMKNINMLQFIVSFSNKKMDINSIRTQIGLFSGTLFKYY